MKLLNLRKKMPLINAQKQKLFLILELKESLCILKLFLVHSLPV